MTLASTITQANLLALYSHQELMETRFTYDVNNNVEYIGVCRLGKDPDNTAGLHWFIQKLFYDLSNNVILISNANNEQEYNKSWDDRATYTYATP